MKATKFSVYYCTPIETTPAVIMPGFRPATFGTLDEAKQYVADQVKEKQSLNPSDTDNGNNHHWYEVYQGEPVNTDGEAQDPAYISDSYYNE